MSTSRRSTSASKSPRARRRRAPRVYQNSKPADAKVDLGEDVKKLAEDAATQIVDSAKKITRSSWFRKFLKFGFIGILLGVILFSLSISFLSMYLTDERIESLLKELVAEHTGGELEIGETSFEVLSGLNLHGLIFYPPQDERGVKNGSERAEEPLLRVSEIALNYRALWLLAANVHVNAASLRAPKLKLKQIDGVWNFQSIIDYRQKHFPAPVVEIDPNDSAPKTIEQLLPVVPTFIFNPINLVLQDIGIRDLAVDFQQVAFTETGAVTTKTTRLEGLSTVVDFEWFGRRSEFNLLVGAEDRLKFSVSETGPKAADPVVAVLNFQSLLQLNDFRFIQFKKDINLHRFTLGKKLELVNLPLNIVLQAKLNKLYAGIKVNQLKVDLLRSLSYEQQTYLGLKDGRLDLFRIESQHQMKFDLFRLNDITKQFLPNSSLFGYLELESLNIEGDVDPAKLNASQLELPYISGNMFLKDIRANFPSLGVNMRPLNGQFAVGAGPSMVGEGSQLDALLDLNLESIELAIEQAKVKQKLAVEKFETEFITRLHYPNPEIPVFKFNGLAEHVKVSGSEIDGVDVPFEFDINADLKKELSRMNLNVHAVLSEILDFNFNANCKESCSFFKTDSRFNINSFSKIYALARPVLQKFVSLRDLPESVDGTLAFNLAALGELPNPLDSSVEEILSKGEIDLRTGFDLQDVNLAIPGHGLKLERFNHRTLVNGTMKEQRVNLKQDFDRLELIVKEYQKPIVAHDYDLDIQIENQLDKILQSPEIVKHLLTSVKSRLIVGKLEARQFIEQPLNDMNLNLKLMQKRARFVNLESLKFEIPDFGVHGNLSANTNLKRNFQPERFSSAAEVKIDHGEGRILPSGVRTSGGMLIEAKLDSRDMNLVEVGGKAKFSNFNVDVPNVSKPDETLLKIEDMNGSIPIAQVVDLSQFSKQKPKKRPKLSEQEEFRRVANEYLEKTRDKIGDKANRVLMVDYGSVRPFFPGKAPLSIRRVAAAGLELKNMEFDVEVRQNWFAVNQYLIEFLGGKIHGDLQFAFDPKPLAIRSSVHLTRLDTRKLIDGFPKLKRRATRWSLFSDPYLDAAMHLNYDLRSNDLGGGLEITSIGKDQLKMMLYYLDPHEKNPTISQIRTALNFGEVSQVSVPIKNGFVGMNVDLRLLMTPIPTPSLRGFPIAQLVENFQSQSEGDEQDEEQESSNSDDRDSGGEKPEENYNSIVH